MIYSETIMPGYAELMSPNKGETAVHGCHCPGDMAVELCCVRGGGTPYSRLWSCVVCRMKQLSMAVTAQVIWLWSCVVCGGGVLPIVGCGVVLCAG